MNVTQVVTIGRNVGSESMPDAEWARFKLATAAAITSCGGVLIQRPHSDAFGSQQGLWEGTVTEDAATFIALTPERHAFTARGKLKAVAARFQQEAIGFIVVAGDRHLIETTQDERDVALLSALSGDRYGEATADGFVVGV